jgi:hypothetical protein
MATKKKSSKLKEFINHEKKELDNLLHHGHHPTKMEVEKEMASNEVKDNFPDDASMNRTTDPVQQPPGGQVTEVMSKDPQANILNAAEAGAQAKRGAATTGLVPEPDPNYTFEIEQAPHKLTVKVEKGLTYNYHVVCQYCGWEGRYLYQEEAEDAAKDHLQRKFPRRG